MYNISILRLSILKRKKMKNIISTILLSSIIILGNGKPTEVDRRIMHLGLNYEFEDAEKLLFEANSKGESLKNHFLYLSIEIMKVEDKADKVPFNKKYTIKEKLNSKLIDYAEDVVEKYEEEELTVHDKFYLASIHGVLGRLYGVQRSWMSAFSEGKSGRNLMEEIIEENPEFTDGYLLLGMMNYYTDRMGGVIEFVAGILGLSGDRNLGLEYLNKVVESGDLNKWQATMVLAELYSRMEGNSYDAIPLLEKLVEQFPNNSKFVNWLCYEYMSTYQLDKIKNMLDTDHINQINDFMKAMYYSNIGEYEIANKMYDDLLSKENTTWPGVFENAKFNRIFNHKFLNNEKISRGLSKDLNEDYVKHYNTYTTNFEDLRKIEKFKIAVRFNNNEFVESFLSNSSELKISEFAESQLKYYTGVYYIRNGHYEKAEDYFLETKKLNPKTYSVRVAENLVHIYKEIVVPVEKVEQLLDEIDEYDNERLEFFAQDLEKKYNL